MMMINLFVVGCKSAVNTAVLILPDGNAIRNYTANLLWACWPAYLISVLYIEYRTRKEKENVNFKNHVIRWFDVLDGLLSPYWKALGLAFTALSSYLDLLFSS